MLGANICKQEFRDKTITLLEESSSMHSIVHEVDLKAPSKPYYITLHIQLPWLMIGTTSLS
jgi:hypothetical protein